MNAHESAEKLEETHHAGGGKRIALLIAILAIFLSLAEMGAKSADQKAIANNIEASNLWAFFQAKTIRITTLRTSGEQMEALAATMPNMTPEQKATVDARIKNWKATADRYETEPATNEGRKELAGRAKASEEKRDYYYAKHHLFEIASAAFQLAIVLASASVVASVGALALLGMGFGAVGIALGALAVFAPTLVHF